MKIKNIRISILILAGLIVLSFAFFSAAQEKSTTDNNVFIDSDQDGLSDVEERALGTNPFNPDTDRDGYSDGAEVASGCDPLKPAPGDCIRPDASPVIPAAAGTSDETNLTNQLMDKVTAMADSSVGTDGSSGIDMTQIDTLIQDTLQTQVTEADIPVINKDGIIIKKQNYENLPAAERDARKKEDFLKYFTTVAYILSSNSPKAITTETDAQSMTDTLTKGILQATTTGNLDSLQGIIGGAEKSLEQMQDVEVPEGELDLHVKGLTFLNYAMTLKDGLQINYADPFASLIAFSKVQSFAQSMASFSFDIQDKFSQYGLNINTPIGLLGDSSAAPVSATSADPGTSTMVAVPLSVPADNSTISTVTVTLKDASNNPVSGKTVLLAKTSGPGTPIISPSSGISNASGIVTFTVKSETAGTNVFTATDSTDTKTITQTASVDFILDTTTDSSSSNN